jgi:hypothetical protein
MGLVAVRGTWCRVVWQKGANISEEPAASVFRLRPIPVHPCSLDVRMMLRTFWNNLSIILSHERWRVTSVSNNRWNCSYIFIWRVNHIIVLQQMKLSVCEFAELFELPRATMDTDGISICYSLVAPKDSPHPRPICCYCQNVSSTLHMWMHCSKTSYFIHTHLHILKFSFLQNETVMWEIHKLTVAFPKCILAIHCTSSFVSLKREKTILFRIIWLVFTGEGDRDVYNSSSRWLCKSNADFCLFPFFV